MRKLSPWLPAFISGFLTFAVWILFPSIRFSAYLLLGCTAMLVCFRLLEVWKFPAAPVLRRVLCICLCIGILIAAVTFAFVFDGSLGDPDADPDYIIVLGCGVNGTVPSLLLRERIDAAYEYLSAHPDVICVVSGGQGPGEEITEAECMFRELTALGIDPQRIWLEDRSTSTAENLTFSKAVIESHTGAVPTEVGIVSGEYHLFRASLMAEDLGFTPYGIPATTGWFTLRVNYFLREVAGVWYYLIFGRLLGGNTQ